MSLVIDRLHAGYGDRVVLCGVDLEVPARGVTILMGPSGAGKSTLLRTLARRAEQLPSFWHHGHVSLGGRDLFGDWTPEQARGLIVLFAQKARLYTASVADNLLAGLSDEPMTLEAKRSRALAILDRWELRAELEPRLAEPATAIPLGLQRRLAVARISAMSPAVILLDEPARDLPASDVERLLAMLRRVSETTAVVLVTHDQRVARRVGDRVALLVAGAIIACEAGDGLFRAPPHPAAAEYVRVGNYWPREPGPAPEPPARPRPDISGFRWILPGQLAGMARPGLLRDVGEDLSALRGLGVRWLATLEETPFDRGLLTRYAIGADHLPMPDMGAPTTAEAVALCRRTRARLDRGEPSAFHCKAGLGRTGTLLAAFLILEGMDPVRALDEIRAVTPLYVQSQEQVDFLFALERHRQEHRS